MTVLSVRFYPLAGSATAGWPTVGMEACSDAVALPGRSIPVTDRFRLLYAVHYQVGDPDRWKNAKKRRNQRHPVSTPLT
jgi:hypothetical protein